MHKSIITISTIALCAISSASIAGGDACMAQPASFTPHAYAEVMGGYANTAWENTTGTGDGTNAVLDYTKNDNGGFVWGGDIGYQWTSWMAFELGGFMLPTTDITVTPNQEPSSSGDIKGSIIYLAGKLSHPIKDNMSLFTKAGVNYQDTRASDSLQFGISSNHYFGPFFGVGISYAFKPNLYAKVEYDRASGQADHSNDDYAPNPNIFVAGLGYSFG